MISLEVSIAGASKVGSTGAILWEPCSPLTDDTSDVESHGECQVYQSLGLSSMPWPKDKDGYAEVLIARGVPGLNAVCLGGRDTRTADIVGKLKPGDTALYSTGPNQAAQLQLKEEKRQAVLLTEDTDGYNLMVLLDGKNKKAQIIANGAVIEVDKQGGISLIDASGGGLMIKDGNVHVTGTLIIGGGQSPLNVMGCLLPASPGGAAAAAMTAIKGIRVGA